MVQTKQPKLTPLEKAQAALEEWRNADHTGASYYQRVTKGNNLRAKVVAYEFAEDVGYTTAERRRVFAANRAMVKAGWDEADLYDTSQLNDEEIRSLYDNYRSQGFTRLEIFELIPGVELAITNYERHFRGKAA